MIQINEIGFSNMFSYGEDNVFFVTPSVTQLLGKNGDGKSSIAAIVEELFYNKNSRGIKKGDIPNRYSGVQGYSCYAKFEVDGVQYKIDKVVQSTTKVRLFRDGVDISGHTATQTYKSIETLLSMDFGTFTKLVYQSMVSSLDFLSATDANRKKFLVTLLGLEKYVDAEKTLKEAFKDSKSQMACICSSLETVKSWIDNNGSIPEVLEVIDVPQEDIKAENLLIEQKVTLANLDLHNSTVRDNLKNIAAYNDIPEVAAVNVHLDDPEVVADELAEAKRDLAVTKAAKTRASSEVAKISSIKEECHVCGSKLEVGNKSEILVKATKELESVNIQVKSALTVVNDLEDKFNSLTKAALAYKKYRKFLKDKDEAEDALDSSKPTELLNSETLSKTIRILKKEAQDLKVSISKARDFNSKVEATNATIEYKQTQLTKFNKELDDCIAELTEATLLNTRLELLAKSLGNKGLIAYKVESMVKVFEGLINEYLQVLADGDFAIGFTVEDTKLVLNTYSSGKSIDIKSLSSGEFNRVNTATLLAVRKMMTSISKTDINLLILDEVVSVLDQEGKDTLISVLLKENNLSSIVVSHGYEHPLANKILVTKTNNISRLEE